MCVFAVCFYLAQSCHEAIQNEIDANRVVVLGVYSAALAFEVQAITTLSCLAVASDIRLTVIQNFHITCAQQ